MDEVTLDEIGKSTEAFFPTAQADWERLNLIAEIGGGPYLSPLNLPEQVEATPENYLAVTPQMQLKRLALSLEELQGLLVVNLGSGKQPLGPFLTEHGIACLDVDSSIFMRDHVAATKTKAVMAVEDLGIADASVDIVKDLNWICLVLNYDELVLITLH